MKTSANGRTAIRSREGERLHTYLDTKGIPTIGVGHTGRLRGLPLALGMSITSKESDDLLAADLSVAEKVVNDSLPAFPITQNAFDALVSLTFNIGVGAYSTSTVARKLKAGDFKGAGDAILMWNKPSEIIPRRHTEYVQFFQSDANIIQTAKPVTQVTPSPVQIEAQSFWSKLFSFFKRAK